MKKKPDIVNFQVLLQEMQESMGSDVETAQRFAAEFPNLNLDVSVIGKIRRGVVKEPGYGVGAAIIWLAAFKSGELDEDKYILVVDNDSCYLRNRQDDADEDAYDMFTGEGQADMVDVCNAAGIPAEHI